MSIIKDKYILGQSQTTSITTNGQEATANLKLSLNTNDEGGIINGTVKNSSNAAISGCVIKIMDLSYKPLAHTVTDGNGNYSFNPFPVGTGYRIFASAAGYTLGEQLPFNLTQDSTVTKNFTLQVDPNANLTFIAGDVYDNDNKSISGAVVELFLIQGEGEQQTATLQAVTFTNDFGQYVFRDLAQGNYIVTIAKIGYVSVNSSVTIDNLNPNKLVTILSVNPILAKGTISGIITDNADNPVVGADVILYRVETNKTLTPLAATRTIDGGVYLFTNIDQGDYKIKSTEGYIVNQ